MKRIRIGTLVGMNDPVQGLKNIRTFAKHGCESFSLTFWQTTGKVNLAETAKADTRASRERLIDQASAYL